MNAVDLEPIPAAEKTQPALDLFLIFAGANITASTFITGATVKAGAAFAPALATIVVGSLVGAALVALLAPVGSRWGVPTIISLRAPLGRPGAQLVAVVLYLTNFGWIALNNVVAASITESAFPTIGLRALAVVLGVASTLVVLRGPHFVALANRAAVPLMVVAAALLALLAFKVLGEARSAAAITAPLSLWRGLDVVIAYQVSWILMFADYSRYTASPAKSGFAVFSSLGLTSIFGMALGALLCAASGSTDPGGMLTALGSPAFGAALLAIATITTNFVNIYLSALALRSLLPRVSDRAAVLFTGLICAGLSVLSRQWIDGYAGFMGVLGLILVPLGGLALGQFLPFPKSVDPRELYAERGEFSGPNWAGLIAWGAGAFVYWRFQSTGATVPALLVSFSIFAIARRLNRSA